MLEINVKELLWGKYGIKCSLGCGTRPENGHCYAIAYTAKQADKWCEKLHGTWTLDQGAYVVSWQEIEPAIHDWLEMQEKSWTWDKLTKEERDDFLRLLRHPASSSVITGDYKQCFEACQALYYTFLCGKGYAKNPATWRDEESSSNQIVITKDVIKQVLNYIGGHLNELL